MLDRLFAAPSVSSMIPAHDTSNLPVIELLAEWTEALGFKNSVNAIEGAPGKYNLVATMGHGQGGLVLAGHTDTVPWDQGLWHHDPFRATFVDGRVYGLGAADMKSFFALVLDALRSMDSKALSAPLILVATADEESTMSGARALTTVGISSSRHALIGEPTGMRPVRAHKGIMMEALRVIGHSGHSSNPALGLNAIEGMQKVMEALVAWRRELQATHSDAQFLVPVPTMNLGHIHGGDNPNRICPSCELQLDLRPLPGMEIESLRMELRERAHRALEGSGFTLEHEALFGGVPPMATPAASDIVQAAERLTGNSAEAVAFATEAPYFTALGAETVVLGPGDIEQAHQPDEFLMLDRIAPMQRVVSSMVENFCQRDGDNR